MPGKYPNVWAQTVYPSNESGSPRGHLAQSCRSVLQGTPGQDRSQLWRQRALAPAGTPIYREPPRSNRPDSPANPVKLTFLSWISV
jgi:hypothetical protein